MLRLRLIRVKTQQNKTNRRAFFSYVLKQENDLVKMKRKISLPTKGPGVLKHIEGKGSVLGIHVLFCFFSFIVLKHPFTH